MIKANNSTALNILIHKYNEMQDEIVKKSNEAFELKLQIDEFTPSLNHRVRRDLSRLNGELYELEIKAEALREVITEIQNKENEENEQESV